MSPINLKQLMLSGSCWTQYGKIYSQHDVYQIDCNLLQLLMKDEKCIINQHKKHHHYDSDYVLLLKHLSTAKKGMWPITNWNK